MACRVAEGSGTDDPVRVQRETDMKAEEIGDSPENVALDTTHKTALVGAHYQAGYLTPLPESAPEASRADIAFLSRKHQKGILERGGGDPYGDALLEGRRWYKADPHPLLASTMPGVDFYVVALGRHGGDLMPTGICELVAIWEGKCYGLPREVNQLLFDTGFEFRESDIDAWASILALLSSAMDQPYLFQSHLRSLTPAVGLPYTPSSSGENLLLFPDLTVDRVDVPLLRRQTMWQGKIRIHRAGRKVSLLVLVMKCWLPVGDTLEVCYIPGDFYVNGPEGFEVRYLLDAIEIGMFFGPDGKQDTCIDQEPSGCRSRAKK
jgi:hypothetical protein